MEILKPHLRPAELKTGEGTCNLCFLQTSQWFRCATVQRIQIRRPRLRGELWEIKIWIKKSSNKDIGSPCTLFPHSSAHRLADQPHIWHKGSFLGLLCTPYFWSLWSFILWCTEKRPISPGGTQLGTSGKQTWNSNATLLICIWVKTAALASPKNLSFSSFPS